MRMESITTAALHVVWIVAGRATPTRLRPCVAQQSAETALWRSIARRCVGGGCVPDDRSCLCDAFSLFLFFRCVTIATTTHSTVASTVSSRSPQRHGIVRVTVVVAVRQAAATVWLRAMRNCAMMVRAVVVAAVAVAVAVAVSAAVAVDSLVRSIFLVLFGSLFCLGNTQSDDGCSSRCSTESGFRCSQLTSPTLCAPFEASSFISVVLTRSANRTTGNATGVDQWSDATVDQLCRLLGVNELRFRLEVDTSEELRLRVSQPYAADPPALNAAVSNRRRQDTSIYRAAEQTSDKQTADDLVAALAGADPVTLGSFGVTSEARVDNTESSSDPFPPGAIAGIVVFAACCCCLIVLGAAVLIVAILIQRRIAWLE